LDLFLLFSVFQSLLWTLTAIQAGATELAHAICHGEESHSYDLYLFWGSTPFFKSHLPLCWLSSLWWLSVPLTSLTLACPWQSGTDKQQICTFS